MKQLLLIRHAKSSWDNPSLPDFDRPLNEKGKKDAPEMAKKLAAKNILPDALVTSPAKRARQTCRAFAKELGVKKKKLIEEPKLYEAGNEEFYSTVEALKKKWDCVAIFSHNPGVTYFANVLTNVAIDDMPTCSVLGIRIDTDNWKDFRTAKKEFWFFDYPGQA
jgi:phosphohistidine phosphatase